MKATVEQIAKFYNEHPDCIGKIKVNTRFGYKTIEYADITSYDSPVYEVKTETGRSIYTSPDHRLYDGNWIKVRDIKENVTALHTVNGLELVSSVTKMKEKEDLYDLQVEQVKEFYANGFVSHNSTFMDAICFVLFNKPFRKINKPQLLNSITNKNLLVELELTVNNTDYLIRRGLKPAIFEIYKNGVFIDQSAETKDFQEILETQILKLNYKTFCQIVILGSANFTPFMQLPAAQRRNIIEDLLDIQIFSTMNTILKEKIATNKTELSDLDANIFLTKKTIKLNTEYNEKLRKKADSDKQEKQNKIEDLLKEQTIYQNKLDTLTKKCIELQQIIETDSKYKTKKQEALTIKTKISSNLDNLASTIDFFESSVTCPTCTQTIEEEFKTKTLETYTTKKQEKEKKLEKIVETLEKLDCRIQKTEKVINELNSLLSEQQKINTELNFINRTIDGLRSELEQISESLNNTNEYSNELEYKKLEDYQQQKELLLEQKELFSIALMLLKDGGIKTQIIKQYIPIMNTLINKYLDQMDFLCQFEMNEAFEETIKSRYRDIFSYASFSEGEKMRIDLAMLFAWREISNMRNASPINLLILDEVMDSSLDSNGTEEFLNIIFKLTNENNVFIVSHKQDQILENFDNVLSFEKYKNFSKLKV